MHTLWSITTTSTQHEPKPTFLIREDNSIEQNLNRSSKVETVEPNTMKTEHLVWKQRVITHRKQEVDGGYVVRLPTKMDPKQLRPYCVASEGRLHIIERRLEQELKDKYQYFMR